MLQGPSRLVASIAEVYTLALISLPGVHLGVDRHRVGAQSVERDRRSVGEGGEVARKLSGAKVCRTPPQKAKVAAIQLQSEAKCLKFEQCERKEWMNQLRTCPNHAFSEAFIEVGGTSSDPTGTEVPLVAEDSL